MKWQCQAGQTDSLSVDVRYAPYVRVECKREERGKDVVTTSAHLTPNQAREVAKELVKAADLIDYPPSPTKVVSADPEPEPVILTGAGWYLTKCGKCVELDDLNCSGMDSGFWDAELGQQDWMWARNGKIKGIEPAGNEIPEDWRIVRKLDGPPPRAPDGYKHMHPPVFRVPRPREAFAVSGYGIAIAAATETPVGKPHWILEFCGEKSQPKTKTIVMRRWRWLCESTGDWMETRWTSAETSTLRLAHVCDEKTVEVPCA